jgi:hypothetical protein
MNVSRSATFKYAQPAFANPTSLAAQKGYIAATDMKTVAPAELQILPAAQPGPDVRGGKPLNADGRFTKNSHQEE